jgi:hypothetical protein
MDFSKFDSAINEAELAKQLEEAKNNAQGDGLETPAGSYVAKIEKMEVGLTKTDKRPMFKVQLRVIEAGDNAKDDVIEYLSHFKNKKPCLFMNRVIYGTKNDANMISSVIGWLEKLEAGIDLEFKNYTQFSELVLDIFEEVADSVELDVEYDPNTFNSISIKEVFDAE